jgi:hypothetical protein
VSYLHQYDKSVRTSKSSCGLPLLTATSIARSLFTHMHCPSLGIAYLVLNGIDHAIHHSVNHRVYCNSTSLGPSHAIPHVSIIAVIFFQHLVDINTEHKEKSCSLHQNRREVRHSKHARVRSKRKDGSQRRSLRRTVRPPLILRTSLGVVRPPYDANIHP